MAFRAVMTYMAFMAFMVFMTFMAFMAFISCMAFMAFTAVLAFMAFTACVSRAAEARVPPPGTAAPSTVTVTLPTEGPGVSSVLVHGSTR